MNNTAVNLLSIFDDEVENDDYYRNRNKPKSLFENLCKNANSKFKQTKNYLTTPILFHDMDPNEHK